MKQHTIGFVDPNYVFTKCQPAPAFCFLCSVLTMRCLCLVCALLPWNGVHIIFHGRLEEYILKAAPYSTVVNFHWTEC